MRVSLVRELQQDVRELNQADLLEVDPEENSAGFMGILIKVHTWPGPNPARAANVDISHLLFIKTSLVFSSVISVFVFFVPSGAGQAEENPRDH